MHELPKSTTEFAKEYHPPSVESKWYDWWERKGLFLPRSERLGAPTVPKKFVITMPPPNVTGFLHIGHALTASVQDTLVRYHRMKGYETVYVPGLDHAGIATQVVVEKYIKKNHNQSRHELGRDAFNQKVWEWKDQYGNGINNQIRLLGVSCDWTKKAFTMDEKFTKAVVEAFVIFHERGLITRDTRIVNWCPSLQSAISDLEVEYVDITPGSVLRVPHYPKAVEFGAIHAFAYKIAGDSAPEIIVETTRPETILGDVAVAVHPEDKRFAHLVGQKVRLTCPFRDDTIPLIFDASLVDKDFGTGAVKVTPAHDPNDYECGQRHKLPSISVIGKSGMITLEGEFHGMHRYECRQRLLEALELKGLYRGKKGHSMRLGLCSRTGDVVEPMVIPQWFVNCASMANKAVRAVKEGDLKITPVEHEATWYRWLENIKPWCVSRQLWWGHRIPAWRVKSTSGAGHSAEWIIARNATEAAAKARTMLGLDDAQMGNLVLEQDEDVLDTWFSSALWPFVLFGWPDTQSASFNDFFPTSLLETGHDILFFWVARMVMCSMELTGKLPFKEVYMHAMVRDKTGEKMSKSKGNVVDPVDVLNGISIEALNDKLAHSNLDQKEIDKAIKLQKKAFPKGIPQCGSDALRFGLLTYTVSGKNVNLDIDRILGYRQFCNKLWNAVRFTLHFALGDGYAPSKDAISPTVAVPLECQWILSRLDACAEACNNSFLPGQYDFAQCTTAIYSFWLYEFCDIFLELIKPKIYGDSSDKETIRHVVFYVIERAIRLLHPMMPFVTEELWSYLPGRSEFEAESISVASYPERCGWLSPEVDEWMQILMKAVHTLRSIKSSYQLPPKFKSTVFILCTDEKYSADTANVVFVLSTLVNADVTVVRSDEDIPAGCTYSVVNSGMTACMMLKGVIDTEKERERLQKKQESVLQFKTRLEAKTTDANYASKVPADVRQVNADKLSGYENELAALDKALVALARMEV
ncbi:valyl-tRNA synthetase [Perkinsela sp. CCAP 1560/4]|nr:valyl-tRNA synthetase [Perkinsela sp. CCAP 1560/4]|eukprot:KNH06466.1 valyl-tRNA synthetase [Perkinsela sp. CCAP 1560/4]